MPEIKERPILFSAPMVRAILEGRKTVTRRPVKGFQIPTEDTSIPTGDRYRWSAIGQRDPRYGFCVFGSTEAECAKELEVYAPCPYGKPGDRLWVRETCLINDFRDGGVPEDERADCQIIYRADGTPNWEGEEELIRWRPSIHMPRWASRILLEITDVRVERLQDISEEQAVAEGLIWQGQENGKVFYSHAERKYPPGAHQQFGISGVDAVSAFRNLWNSVGGDWDANPWVWAVEFKRVTP